MRTYTWEEYYEEFYYWSEDARVRNLSALTSLGTAGEVGEIIAELWANESAANHLLRKAVEEKLEFSISDLMEFLNYNDEKLAMAAVYNSSNRLTNEDIKKLYGMVDDEVIIEICSRRNLTLPEELREEEGREPLRGTDVNTADIPYVKPQKMGLFGTLFAVVGAAGSKDCGRIQSHNGRCSGNCAVCPPHYGYRYGRWYYGHDHVYGCEFGGNKGSGSMD